MRALMTATVPSMIGQFNMNNIKLLLELGYEVDVACNFNDRSVWSDEKVETLKNTLHDMNVKTYQIDFERNMFKINNHLKSYHQIKKLMNLREYNLIHTHTPISSLITRIAFKNSNIFNKCRMIYTAHGFHFFKGNNPINNFIFKNIEKYGAKYTDTLITINKEDYEAAKKFKLRKNGTVEYVPGVGIDIEKINSIEGNREKLLEELNISNDSILLLSVGELNENKNHRIVIEALPLLPANVHYLICGVGSLKNQYFQLAKDLNVENRLHLLGYKDNIIEIMKSCDIFIFPSKREGLSVALMEAMTCGLPCIVSAIRGNVDLIIGDKTGYVCKKNSDYKKFILKFMIEKEYKQIIINNARTIITNFDKKNVLNTISNLYKVN